MNFEIPQELSGDFEPLVNIEVECYTPSPLLTPLEETQTRTDIRKTSEKQPVACTPKKPARRLHVTIDQRDEEDSLDSEDGAVQHSYQDLLIRCPDSTQLIQKFNEMHTRLRSSSAKGVDFSLGACYHRLAAGHDIQLANLQTGTMEDYRVFATPEGLEFKQRSVSQCFVRFTEMCGVLVGCGSAGFRLAGQRGLDLKIYNYEAVDCLTLITDINSFDIASDSDVIRYDLYLLCSWQIAGKSVKTSLVPLTKQQLAVARIKMKLATMAEAKCLFVNELWMLAILKTLHARPHSYENEVNKRKVKQLLDSKFGLSQKMYRIACWMKPCNFFVSKALREKREDRERITKLQQKMVANFSKQRFHSQQLLVDWRVVQGNDTAVAKSLSDMMRQKGFISRRAMALQQSSSAPEASVIT